MYLICFNFKGSIGICFKLAETQDLQKHVSNSLNGVIVFLLLVLKRHIFTDFRVLEKR